MSRKGELEVGEGVGFNDIGAAFICQELAERLAWPRSWISVPGVPYSSNCDLRRPVNKGMRAGQLFHPNEEAVWSTGS
jgi:hypothetical protein